MDRRERPPLPRVRECFARRWRVERRHLLKLVVAGSCGLSEPATQEAAAGTTGTYTLSVREIPPPCTLNTGDIWCGVMTVGNITHQGSTIAHGFLDDPVGGELVDNTGDRELFTGLKVYTVTGIFVGSAGTLDGVLFVNLDEDLSDDELAALALHIDVDGTTLHLDIEIDGITTTSSTWPFSETDSFSAIEGQHAWTGENLDDWSAATTVTVRLRGADNS